MTPDLLVYGSYSRGYKAGGFNLDRSALKSPILPFALSGGAQAWRSNLQFDAERSTPRSRSARNIRRAVQPERRGFRQEFDNFQLNTFNGTVFLVQNINGARPI